MAGNSRGGFTRRLAVRWKGFEGGAGGRRGLVFVFVRNEAPGATVPRWIEKLNISGSFRQNFIVLGNINRWRGVGEGVEGGGHVVVVIY